MGAIIEIIKAVGAIATPVVVAVIGFYLNKHLKRIDEAQWQSRKIVEKRLEIYEKVAPDLNNILCFILFIGDWKKHSPPDIIRMK